jgi:hypothetical protein
MPVSLTKIVNGKLAISDTLLNEQIVKCPKCEQTYRLGYSDGEWHKLSAWLKKADSAMRKSHKQKTHEEVTIALSW